MHRSRRMSALAMAEIGKGLVFSPADDQLTDGYLRSYLARGSLDDLPSVASSYFHVADVYSASPDQLVAGLAAAPGTGDGDGRVWYTFSPVRILGSRGARKARTVGSSGNECWHAEGGPKDVKGSVAGGKLQKFSYKMKTASGVVKPGWLMVEYSLPGTDHLALCKVYRSPRSSRYNTPSPPSSAASSPSRAASGCKRKAEEEHPEAPAISAPRQTLPEEGHDDDLLFAECHYNQGATAMVAAPPSEQHQDSVVSFEAEQDQAFIEHLNSIVAFAREHQGDEEYCKSLGFDERADPDCWKKYLFAMLNETRQQQQEAHAAAHGAPCPQHEEEEDELVTCPTSDNANVGYEDLSDKDFYDLIFSADEEDGGAAVAAGA